MKILFAVLDWGLGHATRDIPLIEGLLKRGHRVDILSSGRALKFLQKNFGKRCLYIVARKIKAPYTKSRLFSLGFVYYLPQMLVDLEKSTRKTQKIIGKGNYDRIISDCRYDAYGDRENSYLIGHQLNIELFPGASTIGQQWFNSREKYYRNVIVLDFNTHELAGPLSLKPKDTEKNWPKFIGVSSHVKKQKVKKDIDYFISISGPEPQRTILEQKIMKQLGQLKGRIVVTLGNPQSKINILKKNLRIYNILGSKQQENMFNRAKFVITRSGYTTMMELAELGIKNALLIPTPGQKEQEGLAEFYQKKKMFHYVDQDHLHLGRDVRRAQGYRGFRIPWKTQKTVKKFIEIIEKN